MNPEIERLIDLAISDGEITDKERSVILKKAEKLGEDPDEVEMILDARLHESKKLNIKVKIGDNKTCPSCGESVKSFQLNCSSCGHEFSNTKGAKIIDDFNNGLKTLTRKSESEIDYKKIIEYVKTFNIPIDKESLIVLLTYFFNRSTENIGDEKITLDSFDVFFNDNKHKVNLQNAYINKFLEVEKISKITLKNEDESLINEINEMKSKVIKFNKKQKRKRGCLTIVGFIGLVWFFALIIRFFDWILN